MQEMCNSVRLLADSPLPQKPSLRRVLLAVLQATQSFYAQLENSGQSWAIKPDYTLTVANGTSDYLLAIDSSYGKPIQVLTYFPSNPSYIQRYVEFYTLRDLQFDWLMPQNIASWMWNDGSNCTAMRMAFYTKDDGTNWVRVLPQPQLTASYLITFTSGDWTANADMEDSPVLGQFHSLIELWAAQSILPSCQWTGDQNYNMAHRKEIALALKNDQERIESDFRAYIRTTMMDHMSVRQSSFDGDFIGSGEGWW